MSDPYEAPLGGGGGVLYGSGDGGAERGEGAGGDPAAAGAAKARLNLRDEGSYVDLGW